MQPLFFQSSRICIQEGGHTSGCYDSWSIKAQVWFTPEAPQSFTDLVPKWNEKCNLSNESRDQMLGDLWTRNAYKYLDYTVKHVRRQHKLHKEPRS